MTLDPKFDDTFIVDITMRVRDTVSVTGVGVDTVTVAAVAPPVVSTGTNGRSSAPNTDLTTEATTTTTTIIAKTTTGTNTEHTTKERTGRKDARDNLHHFLTISLS